ncbi:MAG: DUF1624 domain-containing protein [Deltaproteobacteria bacterium]|nr:DUF1624 domain-containing protein [Deltaproteobacteria bacterium]
MSARPRIDSFDLLRGLVMVVMALDHTRDYLAAGGMDPRDLSQPAMFLTRWITHYCAPVFVFLAGVSAFLYGSRGKTLPQVSRFLWTRGLWLIVLELTVVRIGWTFGLAPEFIPAQVIWAIGCSMVALSGLVFLPRSVIAAVGLVMIFGHNLLDGIRAEDFESGGWIWMILHQPGPLHPFEGVMFYVAYPLVPWIGVIAAGYALGPVATLEAQERRRWLLRIGLGACAGFVLLRGLDGYGNPAPWSAEGGVMTSVLSFINCEKYPPSLLFLLMTLGPSIALLSPLESARGWLARTLITIGRVPLFYYVLHIPLIHLVAVGVAIATGFDTAWLFGGFPIFAKPEGYGVGLLGVYVIWFAVVVALIPLCRWFSGVKQRRDDWWLSYL